MKKHVRTSYINFFFGLLIKDLSDGHLPWLCTPCFTNCSSIISWGWSSRRGRSFFFWRVSGFSSLRVFPLLFGLNGQDCKINITKSILLSCYYFGVVVRLVCPSVLCHNTIQLESSPFQSSPTFFSNRVVPFSQKQKFQILRGATKHAWKKPFWHIFCIFPLNKNRTAIFSNKFR